MHRIDLRSSTKLAHRTTIFPSGNGLIVGMGGYTKLPQDTVLAKQGARFTHIYVILGRRVQITVYSPQEEITVRIAGMGGPVPIAALEGTGRLPASANAMTDLEALQISYAALNDLFRSRPEKSGHSVVSRLDHGLRQAEVFAQVDQ